MLNGTLEEIGELTKANVERPLGNCHYAESYSTDSRSGGNRPIVPALRLDV